MPLDRRIQRTRQLLRDALISLILEMGYDSVRVQDITERANLGRATFYLHYRDKEELLVKSLQAICDDLAERARNGESGISIGLIAFQHAAENRDLYQAILGAKGPSAITRRVREYVTKDALARSRQDMAGGVKSAVPSEIVSNFLIGALIGLIDWWLEDDMPYSAEYMADVFHRLAATALTGVAHPSPNGPLPSQVE